jgi:hypothetical protein
MSPDEVLQIESELKLVYFRDAKVALAAALNELYVAATSPDTAQAARAGFADSLSVAEAVPQLAIKRGEIWLAFNPA